MLVVLPGSAVKEHRGEQEVCDAPYNVYDGARRLAKWRHVLLAGDAFDEVRYAVCAEQSREEEQ